MTISVDGISEQETDSRALTFVIDENGHLLDADGVPFLVEQVYFIDANPLFFETFARSITVIDNQIVLRFHLTVDVDLGTTQAELTGSQTDTITFDAAAGTLTLVRKMEYGGIDSDGAIIHFLTEGIAVLERG